MFDPTRADAELASRVASITTEQLDARTIMELRDFYMQLLKKEEPLAIHQERIEGNLVQFTKGHLNIITPREKEVL